jgi:hypothetical protein
MKNRGHKQRHKRRKLREAPCDKVTPRHVPGEHGLAAGKPLTAAVVVTVPTEPLPLTPAEAELLGYAAPADKDTRKEVTS